MFALTYPHGRTCDVSRLLGFYGGKQHAFHLNRWPNANTQCQKAGKPNQYDKHCMGDSDTQFHIVGMTATASNVRGYWDFEKTKDSEKGEAHYGFRLAGINGVPSGKGHQYLSINNGRYRQKSDAAIAEFIIYKGALNHEQVAFVYCSLHPTGSNHKPTKLTCLASFLTPFTPPRWLT